MVAIIKDNSPLNGLTSRTSLFKEDCLQNVYTFDNTAVAVSMKVECSWPGLTTPVYWLLLLQLTVFSRSAIFV